jgi:3-dehydroquinate synthase
VGVKNGINAFGKKNFLGTFTPPHAVINDAAFLGTLPMREWRAGAAEAVKVALIKDAAFFAWLELRAEAIARRDPPAMHQLIRRCAELHLDHIARGGDPFERGSSRPLDFGHWAAHRLEAMSAHALGHGEAVAIGIALDATYAWQRGWLPAGDHARILAVMRQLGFRLAAPELGDPEALFRGLDEFREHLGGRLTLLMPAGIGRTFEVHEVDHAAMGAAVAWLIADDARERSSAA